MGSLGEGISGRSFWRIKGVREDWKKEEVGSGWSKAESLIEDLERKWATYRVICASTKAMIEARTIPMICILVFCEG